MFGRACVGRNFAVLELQIIIASLMRRYDIVLEKDDQKVTLFTLNRLSGLTSLFPFDQLETREGFLRKPLGCKIGVRRRDI